MQIFDSSSMRHTSGGLPFKLQQEKKCETEKREKEIEDEKHFRRREMMGKCVKMYHNQNLIYFLIFHHL